MKKNIAYYILLFILTVYIVDLPSIAALFTPPNYGEYIALKHWKNITVSYIALYFLLIWAGNFFSSKIFKIILVVFVILSLPVNMFITGYNLLYDIPLSYDVITTILETNTSETSEFVSLISFNNILVVIILSIIPFIIIWKLQISYITVKYLPLFFLVVSLVIIGFTFDKKWATNAVPAISQVRSYMQVMQDKENFLKEVAKLGTQKITLSDNLSKDKKQIFVLVIGESQSKIHFSLYGYKRNTTPLLNELKDKLYLFQNIYAAHLYTAAAIPRMITFDYQDQNKENLINIMSFFKASGFKTYWISTQYIYDKSGSYYSAIAGLAEKKYFLNSGQFEENYKTSYYDKDIIPYYQEIMQDKSDRKFIVVHLTGSHEAYDKRYTEEFRYFYNKNADIKEETINHYDNTIVQTDYVLNTIIEELEIQDVEAYMLYIPDHGTDVYDVSPNEEGKRSRFTFPMYEMPFILWLSEEYKKAYPETVQAVKNNLEKAYKADTLMHSLTDLSQINYEKQDSSKSIFSKNYIEKDIEIDNKVVHKK